jgi:site-specific recombinase XerC
LNEIGPVVFRCPYPGARVQGLAGLRVCDVDLANRRANVVEKGNKSRLVPSTSPMVEAMEAWLKVRP